MLNPDCMKSCQLCFGTLVTSSIWEISFYRFLTLFWYHSITLGLSWKNVNLRDWNLKGSALDCLYHKRKALDKIPNNKAITIHHKMRDQLQTKQGLSRESRDIWQYNNIANCKPLTCPMPTGILVEKEYRLTIGLFYLLFHICITIIYLDGVNKQPYI